LFLENLSKLLVEVADSSQVVYELGHGRYLTRPSFSMEVLNEKLESIMTVEEQALWIPCSAFKLNADQTHYIIYCCQGEYRTGVVYYVVQKAG
jgi:hypothetical protein